MGVIPSCTGNALPVGYEYPSRSGPKVRDSKPRQGIGIVSPYLPYLPHEVVDAACI